MTNCHLHRLYIYFYPWSPKVEPWVNRCTFFSPPPPSPSSPSPSHHQICQRPLTKTWFQRPLTIETENAVGGGGGGRGSFAVMRSPPPSHHQIFVSLRYRKHQFSVLYCMYCMYCCCSGLVVVLD